MKRYHDGVMSRFSSQRSRVFADNRVVEPRSVRKKKHQKDVDSVYYKLKYHPKKDAKQKATFRHRSGHEQKKDGKYNKDCVKTYYSNDLDYNGSESDSNVKVNLNVESDNTDTRRLWRGVYYDFRDNNYNTEGGFKCFS